MLFERKKLNDILSNETDMKLLSRAINNRKHLIFLDIEGTQFSHEIIAIGAIRVDLKKDGTFKKVHPGFKCFVTAKEKIGKVVENLTGITESTLKRDGISFRKAQIGLKKYVGRDYKSCIFITFGSHDVRMICQSLQYNLDCNKDEAKLVIHNHLDFSEFIANFIRDDKGNPYSLENYLKLFQIKFNGTKHDPLDDAKNLMTLYQAVQQNSQILEDEYYKVLKKTSHLVYPIQKVLSALLNGRSVSPEEFSAFVKDYLS